MADTHNSENQSEKPLSLSERIENHRREIQYLVKQGGEQAQYEFKRTVFLSRENLDERLDFVKLVQSMANAEIATERCIVVGADPKEKKFHPVTNASDFDPANLSKILGAYLDPLPRFQVFNLTTDESDPFVVISLDPNQTRPIMVAKAGQTSKDKTRLEVGDVWIKRNTDTVRATRADLDLMYKVRSEEDAEDRARKRLKHLLELATPQQTQISTTVVPTFALIVGPRDDLKRFTEELVAANDLRRFQMLLEAARENLVEGWDQFEVLQFEISNQLLLNLAEFYKNQFVPVLESVVEVALLSIKHGVGQDWIKAAISLLLESFDVTRTLNRLPLGAILRTGSPILPWWKPAFELFIGVRAIAIYAVARKRLSYLSEILPRIVTWEAENGIKRTRTPILFWPFRPSPFNSDEFRQGRAYYFWNQRVGAAWARYFGNFTKFVEASSQLEFLLEFNSYLGMNTLKDPKYQAWLQSSVATDIAFDYVPDLYDDDLRSTVPMAEHFYDILAKGTPFPAYLFVDARMPGQVFGSWPEARRLQIYGDFLRHLKAWQESYRFEGLRRFPFMWDWDGRLGTTARASK